MKKLLSELLWGRNSKLNGVMAVGIISLIVLGCTCNRNFDLGDPEANNDSDRTSSNRPTTGDDQDGSLPSDSEIQSLIRDTTSDFAEAIDTGNFSELYGKASSDFQSSYTEEQMKNAFDLFIREKRRVVPILEKALSLQSDLSPDPYIRTEKGHKVLVVSGQYPTKPLPVKTEYEYVFRDGEWKILKLVVKITK